MARLIAITLLAVNLLLLGYHLIRPGESATPSVPESAPWPEGTPRIVLLEEMEMSPGGTGPVGEAGRCFAVGPYETPASRERARARIEPVAETIVERESEALVELGYWVTLPPFADFEAAGAAMRDLQRAGFQDVAVVTDPEGELRVSLGYYLEEANARSHREALREKGFEAETRLQREPQPRYWLDYRLREGAEPPAVASGAALVDEFSREIPCDGRLLSTGGPA
ncbi:MAG: SPOR domain-containing protein [Gammaproteobacteria bacterium]